MNSRKVGITILLVHALAGSALAAELFSPVFQFDTGDSLQCIILNVSSKDHTLSAEVLPAAESTGDVLVPPGGFTEAGAAYLDCIGGCYCRFTVDGPTTSVRAAGTLFNGITGNKIVVPAE